MVKSEQISLHPWIHAMLSLGTHIQGLKERFHNGDCSQAVMRNILRILHKLIIILLNDGGVKVSTLEVIQHESPSEELDVRWQSNHFVILQGLVHLHDGGLAIISVHYQLGDHWIVKGRDLVSLLHSGVHPDGAIGRGWLAKDSNFATLRQELLLWILCVYSGLKRVSSQRHLGLLHDWKRLATGNTDLPFNEIKPCNHLSGWMLHLQPRVHLHEIKFVSVRIKDELNRSCILIAHSFGCLNGCLSHLISEGL